MSPGEVHVLKSASGMNCLFMGVSIVTLQTSYTMISYLNVLLTHDNQQYLTVKVQSLCIHQEVHSWVQPSF